MEICIMRIDGHGEMKYWLLILRRSLYDDARNKVSSHGNILTRKERNTDFVVPYYVCVSHVRSELSMSYLCLKPLLLTRFEHNKRNISYYTITIL